MRWVLIAAAVAVAVVLFLVLRPGDEEEEAAPTTTNEVTVSAPATTEEPPAVTVIREQRFRITVRDGRVEGGVMRATIPQGTRVVLVVRADVSDEVHLHGYDVMRNVAPGIPAQLAFEATTPGLFEVELEERHLLIAELEVRP